MQVNIVNSQKLFAEEAWSITMLLPHDQIQTNKEFKLVKLGTLVEEIKELLKAENEGTVNYIGLENIETGTGRLVNYYPRTASEIKSTSKRFEVGDILYGRLRPNLNKVFLNNSITNGRCSTEILVLRPKTQKVNSLYLSELLRTKEMNNRIVELIKGAALPRVNSSDLLSMEIPLPRLEKQNELAKIIARKRDELEEHIRQVELIPKELNQIILNAYT